MQSTSPPPALVDLVSMPNEILLSVADNLSDEKDINNFARTNRHLNSLLNPYLYAYDLKHNNGSALWWAVKHGQQGTAEKSLDAGADINAPAEPKSEHNNWTPPAPLLVRAVACRPRNIQYLRQELYQQYVQRHLSLLQLLIDRGVDIDAKDQDYGQTAVQKAASQGDDEVVRLLIENGADVHARCSSDNTVLHAAALACNAETINFLIDKGLDVNATHNTGGTPLHAAASTSNIAAVRTLIDRGAVVQFVANDRSTPLLLAARLEESTPTLEALINHGANVNHRGEGNETPLHAATLAKNAAGVRLLIEHGAKADVGNTEGNSPLHHILRHKDFEPKLDLMKLLLENGAYVNFRNRYGSRPLHTAASTGDIDAVKLLIEHGADLDVQDSIGYTALHIAVGAAEIKKELVTLLLENGAFLGAKSDDGKEVLVPATWRTPADNAWIEATLAKYGSKARKTSQGSEGSTYVMRGLLYQMNSLCLMYVVLRAKKKKRAKKA
ncbi:hypothetical protein PRK78_005651 [Emydomyces testavorans]|uniref:Uncharacterized protein n=1 Tax=Emydomyces testavorans TaxID=2070801 RepID=A0AAF0DJZ5_9EURO|nr:hypothetical protein PRK78_005651 [Emydomyces testavorans]